MIRLMIIIILSFFALNAQTTKEVLFLGNSYTYYNDMPNIIEQLALSGGDTLIHDQNTPGGYKLIEHATNSTSVNKIRSNDWDYVVLQDQSLTPAYYYIEFYTGAEQLIQLINANEPCLNKTIFYMTWGRENSSSYPYDTHQQRTTDAYNTVADIFDTEVAPVGAAWKKVRDDKDPIDLYYSDGSHPSYAGSYLAACVFYATIFDQSPVGLSYTGSLSADDASYLQQKAFEACNEYVALGLIHTGTSPDTITDVYTAHLNNTQSQLNSLIEYDTLKTSFDFTYTGFSEKASVGATLEYIIHQDSKPVANDSVPVFMPVTPRQCVRQTSTFPLNIDLANVDPGWFLLEILLNDNPIEQYLLRKEITQIAGENNNDLPSGFSLDQNYPNPFNPATTISYRLGQSQFVDISIYNMNGKLVKTLVTEIQSRGSHSVTWHAAGVSTGLYLYRIKTPNGTETRKCMFIR